VFKLGFITISDRDAMTHPLGHVFSAVRPQHANVASSSNQNTNQTERLVNL